MSLSVEPLPPALGVPEHIEIHVHLPESVEDVIRESNGERVHVILPESLEKVVRDMGDELIHSRHALSSAVRELATVLREHLAPLVIPPPVVKVTVPPPIIKIVVPDGPVPIVHAPITVPPTTVLVPAPLAPDVHVHPAPVAEHVRVRVRVQKNLDGSLDITREAL